MRPDHPVLSKPLPVPHRGGRLKVLESMGSSQAEMGEALTLDGTLNSCDAEVIAKGLSDKGAERGAIVRHGHYTLWGYAGGPERMTPAGRALFINTVHYAMAAKGAPLLERKRAKTRDDLFAYLVTARTRVPGLLRTALQYLPPELGGRTLDEVEAWLSENRPYLRAEGRRFEVDALARALGRPNHTRAFLEACLAGLSDPERAPECKAALMRYTNRKSVV